MYLVIDTETGGLDPQKHSLLSAYFGVYNKAFVPMGSLYMKLVPDDVCFKVTAQAMAVNGIDLSRHTFNATMYRHAKEKLKMFLSDYGQRFYPVGHNLSFDLGFIHTHLLDKETWDNYVSYRGLDTATLGLALHFAGLIPRIMSLKELADHFHIKYDAQRLHDAEEDATLTIKVYERMLELLKPEPGAKMVSPWSTSYYSCIPPRPGQGRKL